MLLKKLKHWSDGRWTFLFRLGQLAGCCFCLLCTSLIATLSLFLRYTSLLATLSSFLLGTSLIATLSLFGSCQGFAKPVCVNLRSDSRRAYRIQMSRDDCHPPPGPCLVASARTVQKPTLRSYFARTDETVSCMMTDCTEAPTARMTCSSSLLSLHSVWIIKANERRRHSNRRVCLFYFSFFFTLFSVSRPLSSLR